MAQCYDFQSNKNVYCSTNYAAYIAVGIVLPLVILILTFIISAYIRYRRRRLQREQQQINMTTVVSIDNTDEDQQQTPYNYSYPPNYASVVVDNSSDKPPSYEQTIQHLSETNPTRETDPAILPVSTITSAQPIQLSRNQT